MSPRYSLWLVALLAVPTLAGAEDRPVTATSTALSQYRQSAHVWHDIRFGTDGPDLYERTFPRTTRLTSLRECHEFDCFLQNADTVRVVSFPREERIWASATGHHRGIPCGSHDDLLSTFERYDGCEPFLRRIDHAIVALPRETKKPLNPESNDDSKPEKVDRRPAAAAAAPGDQRVVRGAAVQRDRGARR